jgi:nucleoside-diphosphate-sugar epimerase
MGITVRETIKLGSYKALVFGAAGYIGSTLTERLLNAGYHVRGVDNGQRNSCDSLLSFISHPNFEFQYGNINSEKDVKKAFDGVDACILLSACVGMPITNAFTEYSRLVNVDGTRNVLKHRPANIPLVFSSTGSIYGALKEVCTEISPINPLSPYGLQKKEAEDAVISAGNSCAFRYATAYGPSRNFREDLLINTLISKAIKEKTITIFQADFARTFIYISDFCDSIIYAFQHWDKFNGEVFNGGSEENNWSKREIAEYLKKRIGCSVFYADEGFQDPDMRNYVVSYQKLRATGFKCEVSMEQGIENTIKAIPLIGLGNNRYQDKLL